MKAKPSLKNLKKATTVDEFVSNGMESTEPPKEEKQRTTLFVPTATHIALRTLAVQQRTSMTDLILAAVKEKYNV